MLFGLCVLNRACGNSSLRDKFYFIGGQMFTNIYNRHVLVELVEEEKEQTQSLIALPEDYKKSESPQLVVKVLQKASDVSLELDYGDYIVIERRMLSEIEIKGEKNYLVLENYIYGRIDDENY